MTQFNVGNLARNCGFAKSSNTALQPFQPGNFSRIETSIPLPASSWTGMGRGAKGALSHYYHSSGNAELAAGPMLSRSVTEPASDVRRTNDPAICECALLALFPCLTDERGRTSHRAKSEGS
jgi:hypothetical protein